MQILKDGIKRKIKKGKRKNTLIKKAEEEGRWKILRNNRKEFKV